MIAETFAHLPPWLRALKTVRRMRGYTLTGAAEEAGISASLLSRVERGEREPDISLVERLCELYEALPWTVLTGMPEPGEWRRPNEPPGFRLRRLRLTRGMASCELAKQAGCSPVKLSLVEHGKRRLTVRLLVRCLDALEAPPAEFFTPPASVHLVDFSVSGAAAAGESGVGIVGGDIIGNALLPIERKGPVLALEIVGDSMSPYYIEGDVVFCSPGIEPRSGRPVVAKLKDGTALCKLLLDRRDGVVVLGSYNSAYEPLEVEADEIEAIWPVLGSYRRERR